MIIKQNQSEKWTDSNKAYLSYLCKQTACKQTACKQTACKQSGLKQTQYAHLQLSYHLRIHASFKHILAQLFLKALKNLSDNIQLPYQIFRLLPLNTYQKHTV